tara:strand:+ start:1367 stop:1546 length:180 start_codon:yes stop_codon:yes gene_type:complete
MKPFSEPKLVEFFFRNTETKKIIVSAKYCKNPEATKNWKKLKKTYSFKNCLSYGWELVR